jgi:hypothetical protein
MPSIMKYGEERKPMENTTSVKGSHMAWAVLSKAVNGRSEVIKVTNHEDADQAVKQNPEVFYKAGPFLIA